MSEQEIISGILRYGYNVRMEEIIEMHNCRCRIGFVI